ncbi:MAG: serine O-acetyltransferase [Clostridia bacterium]|nr:serine O-acetyltransferase [Clostridia bacterium]
MKLTEDVKTVLNKDPAARNYFEVLFTYPGVRALFWYRRAHWLYNHKYYFLARRISQRTARKTGIEIHPGATIGDRLFIDHGTGVVIGETTIIGNDVVIYQGVTLGGTGKEKGKRHPTLEDRVMVSAGSSVLGPVTIGHDSKVGAGAVVLKDVPPNCTVVGIPGRIVKMDNVRVQDMDQVHIPDPVLEELKRLNSRIEELELKLGLEDGGKCTLDGIVEEIKEENVKTDE